MSTDIEVRLKNKVSLQAKPRLCKRESIDLHSHQQSHKSYTCTYGGNTVQLLTLSIGLKKRSGVNDAPARDNEWHGPT